MASKCERNLHQEGCYILTKIFPTTKVMCLPSSVVVLHCGGWLEPIISCFCNFFQVENVTDDARNQLVAIKDGKVKNGTFFVLK